MAKREVLRQYFGHSNFRPGQEALIDGILAGRDALGIMPTGGGKSLCYQVPALLLPGLTLVVSPLISLMKDQVAALNGVGIPAAFLNSALDAQAFQAVCREIRQGMHKLIYVAPERLLQEGFLALMQEQKIAQVAVDEAHCISQWGQDFRPSYRKITEFVARLPRRPVLSAFTATATAEVQADILAQLELRDPVKVVTGFDRPTLYFAVQQPKRKQPVLTALVEARRDRSGIVYCATRSGVEKICDLLCQRGIPATRYHAGLSEEERQRNQDDFQFDRKTVMVATNAFGMGIDKSNVSFVIHYNMPKSLEAYYQEAGRAGRDGEAAECILLYGPGDVATAQFFLQQAGENEDLSPEERAEVQARDARRLEAMVNYCKTTHCLRGHLLDYFGQAHDPTCGNCGNCRSQFVQVDITRQARMILSCVKRVQGKLGYYVGADLLSKVLRGSRSQRVLTLGLDGLTTYGLLRDTSEALTRRYLEALEEAGYLVTEPVHKTLRPTPQAGEVLFRGSKVFLTQRAAPAVFRPREEGLERSGQQPEDQELMAALKATRLQLARQEEVPLYVIFSNATLADMARRRPQTMEEFLSVSGVGEVKARKYGAAFLAVLARAEKEEV
ncbi:MAG: DNA helicase RecQ [Evtepia gabavorous]|uniref:DNA helicase RecQ n=1 Tax=Evtepia gabavorous TaxID=2211183 RepID=UPI00399C1D81